MLKTYKYRIYPTKEQNKKMHDTCFLCSLVYNQSLEERKQAYENEQKLTVYDQITSLPAKKVVNTRLNEVYAQVLQDTVRRLDKSFQAFFRRVKSGDKPGYPRFHCARNYDSFTYPQKGFEIAKDGTGGRLHLSKIGTVRIKFHRPIEGNIKTLTIRRQAGKWFACFSCEVGASQLPRADAVAGVDLGLTHLAITSDGEFFPPSKHLRSSEKKLKQLQRAVSRKIKGSGRRKKAIRQMQRLHLHIANQRRDQAFKTAHALLTRYDRIALEDLRPKNMLKNHHLAKSIADASWGVLTDILESKAAEWGKEIVYVDPRNTSQECSSCGTIVKKALSVRIHRCPECGLVEDRDVNAARNILKRSGLDEAIRDSAGLDELRSPCL